MKSPADVGIETSVTKTSCSNVRVLPLVFVASFSAAENVLYSVDAPVTNVTCGTETFTLKNLPVGKHDICFSIHTKVTSYLI